MRDALMGLLFTNVEREYYLREMERLIGHPVANISKEMVRLEAAGLVQSRRLGNLKLYSVNKESGLFDELKAIVGKTVGLPDLLRLALARVPGVEAAAIYGSFARGGERADSDIDLLVIGSCSDSNLIKAIKSLEKRLDREINYALYSREDWNNKIKEKNPFIRQVLKNKMILLQGKVDVKGFG
ncbi:MAG: nucleotidyltransferase domain-containing protein [Elusimicrobia bacterium]|nr:nucleotidyltransferase domain-containing protein [Elusimicrobiota bacterium]